MKDKPIYPEGHKTVWQNKWAKVKVAPNGFTYFQRLGTNSIAFILMSKDPNDAQPVGVIHEYKDPFDQFMTTAFGGSIDQQKYRNDLELLVRTEVAEESGFRVQNEDIQYLGKVLCSTQMNQFVHLFCVYVDKTKQQPRTTTNKVELQAKMVWLSPRQVMDLADWKAITILTKRAFNETDRT